jgi:hypothetical protein
MPLLLLFKTCTKAKAFKFNKLIEMKIKASLFGQGQALSLHGLPSQEKSLHMSKCSTTALALNNFERTFVK